MKKLPNDLDKIHVESDYVNFSVGEDGRLECDEVINIFVVPKIPAQEIKIDIKFSEE